MRFLPIALRQPHPATAMLLAIALAGPAAYAQAPVAPGDAAAASAVAGQPDRLEITGRHYDNAVGSSDAASQGTIRADLLRSRPALRPGEVLEFVPGVIVTQHSGDGKAKGPRTTRAARR